jgi:hypothetical protein
MFLLDFEPVVRFVGSKARTSFSEEKEEKDFVDSGSGALAA